MSKYMDIVTGSQKVFPSDADVVEVVRCKDCKYKERKRCGLTGYTVRAYDYCSYGERKQEE